MTSIFVLSPSFVVSRIWTSASGVMVVGSTFSATSSCRAASLARPEKRCDRSGQPLRPLKVIVATKCFWASMKKTISGAVATTLPAIRSDHWVRRVL